MGPKRGQHTPAGGGPVCCRQSLVPFDFLFWYFAGWNLASCWHFQLCDQCGDSRIGHWKCQPPSTLHSWQPPGLDHVEYRVSKKNDATFNLYLFLYYNLNWYAFSIYCTQNHYTLRISNWNNPNTNVASMVAMETNMLIFRFWKKNTQNWTSYQPFGTSISSYLYFKSKYQAIMHLQTFNDDKFLISNAPALAL